MRSTSGSVSHSVFTRNTPAFRLNCTHNQTCWGRCILCGRKISLAELFAQPRRKEVSR